jgi:voltage-dependent potassium channel beta subunit
VRENIKNTVEIDVTFKKKKKMSIDVSPTAMKYRFLGDSGLLVSWLSFGTWVNFDKSMDFEKAYTILERAYKYGINFFDNAECYAKGESEIIMGRVVKKGIERGVWKRSDLVISTKIFFGTADGPNDIGCSRKHLIEGTKASLRRLNMEYVDLIFCHRPDPFTPMEETVRGMNWIINQGWAFYWGTSEWNFSEIEKACEIADRLGLIRPVMDQSEYNFFQRSNVDYFYFRLYTKYKWGVTTFSPLACGVLTGKYSKGIPLGSRFSKPDYAVLKKDMEERVAKADKLAVIAQELGCTLAQMSIAWCLSNKNVSTVILGATNTDQLDENMKALATKLLQRLRIELMISFNLVHQ